MKPYPRFLQLRFLALAIAFSLAIAVSGFGASLSTLVKSDDRPELGDIQKLSAADRKEILGVKVKPDVKGLEKLFQIVGPRILEASEGKKIVLLGRDGELLYDAMMAAADSSAKGAWIKKNVVLMNLSRPIALNSSLGQLEQYFKAHGIEMDVKKGKIPELLFFDTGNRGTIFVSLFKKIAAGASGGLEGQKKIAQEAADKIRVSLLTSEVDKGNVKEIQKQIKNAGSQQEILSAIDSQYFDELPIPASDLKSAGVPTDKYKKWRWVVDNMEYVPHWTGRAAGLNSSGSKVSSYEPESSYKGGGTREEALALQLRISEVFSEPKNRKIMLASVPGKAAVAKATKASAAKATKPAEGIPIAEAFDAELDTGTKVISKKMGTLTVTKFVDEGLRGKVYQVKGKGGKLFALKVAKDHEQETLDSLKSELDKEKDWKKLKLPHAGIKERGEDFLVKDWVDGERADSWIQKWVAKGHGTETKQAKALLKMLEGIAAKGWYVGDLNPKNLIWDGKNWVIVDSGSARDDMEPEKALKRFQEKMTSRWGKVIDCRVLFEQLSLK